MRARIIPRRFTGTVRIPASKSHTIRQLFIASLAEGVSEIRYPLDSLDASSCVSVCRGMGAEITGGRAADPLCPNPPDTNGEKLVSWKIRGPLSSNPGARRLDVGNSGTTLYLALAIAGLQRAAIEFTGDEQIERRGAAPLLDALSGLGVRVSSREGRVPIVIQGPWKGGKVSLCCPTSQYLSALLLAAPLAPEGTRTEIAVPLLNEKPYIEMTLSYLKAHNIPHEAAADFSRFVIPGGASWKPFSRSVPGDFSSAAFPAAAAAISGGEVCILGLDPEDTQGDKYFFDILAQMGCTVEWKLLAPGDWSVTVSRNGALRGGTFDLNAAPDLLPAAAVTAAYALGDTALVNIAHARIKETDRIAVMSRELGKLGVSCTETPGSLVIHGRGGLLAASGVPVDGCGDHRVVMAFAAAALGADAPLEIDTAESAAITYPGFLELLGETAGRR